MGKPKQSEPPQRPELKGEDLEKMRQESMAILVVRFKNCKDSKRFWSKCGQRKHRNISEAVNYLMWLVNGYKKWRGRVETAAIFDARIIKSGESANKIYQYENSCWQISQPIEW